MDTILTYEKGKIISMSGGSSVESVALCSTINLHQFLSGSTTITTEIICKEIVIYYDTMERVFAMVEAILPIHYSIGTSIMVNAPPSCIIIYTFLRKSYRTITSLYYPKKQKIILNGTVPSRS